MIKLLIPAMVLVALAGCSQNYVEQACDKTTDQSVRYGLRETGAREGLYVKCVEPGHGWDDYTLMRDGKEVPEVLQ